MLSALIALVVGGALGAALVFTTSLHPAISATIGIAAFALIYFLLMRQVMNKVNSLMEASQRDLMANRAQERIDALAAAAGEEN